MGGTQSRLHGASFLERVGLQFPATSSLLLPNIPLGILFENLMPTLFWQDSTVDRIHYAKRLSSLKMEVAPSSEILVSIYRTVR
jgi:hypothetical protein